MIIRTQIGKEDQHFELHRTNDEGELTAFAYIQYVGSVEANFNQRLGLAAFRETLQPHKQSAFRNLFQEAATQEEAAKAQKVSAMAFIEALTYYVQENSRDREPITPSIKIPAEPLYYFRKEDMDGSAASVSYMVATITPKIQDVLSPKNKEIYTAFEIFANTGDKLLNILCSAEDKALFEKSIKQSIQKLSTTDFDFRQMMAPKKDM
jgi:hypothetical protein